MPRNERRIFLATWRICNSSQIEYKVFPSEGIFGDGGIGEILGDNDHIVINIIMDLLEEKQFIQKLIRG